MAERMPNQENTENTAERASAAVEAVEAGDLKWSGYAKGFLGKSAKIGGISVLSLLAVPVAIVAGVAYGAFKLMDYGADKLMAGAPSWMKDLYKKLFSGSKKEK
jgi:hypothetical protein